VTASFRPDLRSLCAALPWLWLLGCSACRGGPVDPPTPPEAAEETQGEAEATRFTPDEEAPSPGDGTPVPADPAAMAALAEASNAFGFDLYQQVAGQSGNVVLSPMSISLAFAMTYAGARGDTAAEMRRVLRFSAEDDALHASAGKLLAAWNGPAPEGAELRVVNRLYGERAYTFVPAFLELTRDTYRAPLEASDFRGAPDAERERINAWVSEQTRERIEDLLPQGSVDALTRLVLVNAIYFLGQWADPFDPDDTADETFHPARGKPRPVPMMRQTAFHQYAEVDGLQVLEMRYGDDDLAMTLVLPRAGAKLGAVERRLTAARVARWVNAMDPRRVRVLLPRFEIRDAEIDLGSVLPGMGMRLAFDVERADFSGMARPSDPDEELYISGAFHKAFIKVDEEGTEAAAATAVIMGARGGPPPEPPEFRADRPFLFMIRHVPSGAILFLGRVHDPAP
jgi:serpin B